MPPLRQDPKRTEPAASSGTRARRRGMRLLGSGGGLAVVLLAGGFLVFADGISRTEPGPARSADGIVVLTGGASRIDDAVELLAANRGQRLLISGVHPTTTPGELTRMKPEFERLLACCIDLGHEATNTIGNAIETGRWVREHGFRSLIVVTSGWHMPRALIEIENELSDVTLIPYPVVSERMREEPWWSDAHTIRLLLLEYVKFVASYARTRFNPSRFGAGPEPADRRSQP